MEATSSPVVLTSIFSTGNESSWWPTTPRNLKLRYLSWKTIADCNWHQVSTLLREHFSIRWTLMCSRQYFRQGQRGQTRVSPHLFISTFRLPVPQRLKRVRFIGENMNKNVKAAQNLWGKRWTALTLPSSHPVMTTLSVMGTKQLTASGWPENWSLCRPYWPLDREID